MKALLAVGAVAFATLVAGCGDGVTGATIPTLEALYDGSRQLPHQGTWTVGAGEVSVGEVGSVSELRIINTGSGPLDITSITVQSTPPGAFKLASDPVTLAPLGTGPFTIIEQGGDDSEGITRLLAYLILDRTLAAGASPTAVISVASDSVVDGVKIPVTTFNVLLEGGSPRIQVNPTAIDFPTVRPEDGEEVNTLQIFNPGNEELIIDGFTLKGHPNFSVGFPGMQTYKVSPETIQGVTFDEPILIPAQGQIAASIVFFASGPEPATGELLLKSNDPLQLSGTLVPLQANVGGPCIALSPTKVDFGGKLVGRVVEIDVKITSCGDKPLTISSLALDLDQSSEEFQLKLDGIDGVDGENVGSLGIGDPPLVLAPNDTATFKVVYVAGDVSPLDGTGLPIWDTGVINISTNSFIPETRVDVKGFGVLVECPTAVLIVEGVEDGGEVSPQTKLKLIGSESYAATGGIAEYAWRVNQPIGSVSTFKENPAQADPTFEVNVAGTYEFELTVKDENGEPSCAPARTTIYVIPTEAIHIELLWRTPADDDETNEGAVAGSDLDLHFLHPFASSPDVDGDGQPDGWFDPFFDAFWNNEHPNWNNLSPAIDDDPDLDRDDTDGGGPENVNLSLPESGACYRVGVHYWEDNDFGPAFATLRVYIYANAVFEVEGVELRERDMWSVTSVCWPANGDVPEVVKVCEDTFDSCESTSDCGGEACDLRIARDYCSPLLPCN